MFAYYLRNDSTDVFLVVDEEDLTSGQLIKKYDLDDWKGWLNEGYDIEDIPCSFLKLPCTTSGLATF